MVPITILVQSTPCDGWADGTGSAAGLPSTEASTGTGGDASGSAGLPFIRTSTSGLCFLTFSSMACSIAGSGIMGETEAVVSVTCFGMVATL
jgi:hypothetical protein